MSKLTLADIADVRAYEAEREEFRSRIMELKRRRRVSVGPFVSLVFENRETIRYQIQEMARVEKIVTNEGIQVELDVYNPLIPDPGRLSATLFLELVTDEQLREWLPKLVGIEQSIELRFSDGTVVRSGVEAAHASQLTREETTSAVHYIDFHLDDGAMAALRTGDVKLAVNHPEYSFETVMEAETVAELVVDATG